MEILSTARAVCHGSPTQRGTAFTYDMAPLPSPSTHIRLLSLLPSETPPGREGSSPVGTEDACFSTELHCSISTCRLGSTTRFNALSYTWGPPGDGSRPVKVMSSDGKPLGDLSITPSLDVALRHLRALAGGNATTLWIDQICINQSDVKEKTEQVKVMGRIYRSAEQVRVWLGPAADGSDDLMDAFEAVARRVSEPDLNMASLFTRNGGSQFSYHMSNLEPTNPTTMLFQEAVHWVSQRFQPHLHAMAAWCARPWFQRAWIVQEFALGENTVLICGYKTLPAELLDLAITVHWHCLIEVEVDLTPETYHKLDLAVLEGLVMALCSIRKKRQDYQLKLPRTPGGEDGAKGPASGDGLLDILWKLYVRRGTEATDVRDRIYALLGLAVDTARLGLEPDYSITDYSRILVLAAKAIIRTGNLKLLSFSQFPKERELPSWVPDWRPGLTSPYHLFEKDSTNIFSASSQSRATITETDDIAIIGLAGCRVDTIEEVADPWMEKSQRLQYPQHIRYLTQVRALCESSAVKKGRPIYATEARKDEAFWRVPIADMQFVKGGILRATEVSAVLHAYYLETCRMFEQVATDVAQNGLPSLADMDAFLKRKAEFKEGDEYCSSMLNMEGTRPFRTREGYVGLGPVVSRVGDLVVVFAGAGIPHVIRPRGGDRFEFVGDAYCDGAMDGEVWDEARLETFLLV